MTKPPPPSPFHRVIGLQKFQELIAREWPSSPKVSLEATGSCHRHPSRHLNWYEFPDRRARLSRGWRKPSSFVLIYLDAQLECFARHCACFGKRFAVRYQLWKRGATHAIAALAIGKERAQVLRINDFYFFRSLHMETISYRRAKITDASTQLPPSLFHPAPAVWAAHGAACPSKSRAQDIP